MICVLSYSLPVLYDSLGCFVIQFWFCRTVSVLSYSSSVLSYSFSVLSYSFGVLSYSFGVLSYSFRVLSYSFNLYDSLRNCMTVWCPEWPKALAS